MKTMNERLAEALAFLKQQPRASFTARIGIIPGTGWEGFSDVLKGRQVIGYDEIPAFPRATYHKGAFTFGTAGGIPVILAGRLHYYEGRSVEETVMPLRLLKMLGVEKLIVTNASGGIAPGLKPGDLMVIEDQIQLFLPSPLRGENKDFPGERFPDMTQAYSPRLREAIFRAGKKAEVPLKKGVYIQTAGPQFETPAEIRALKLLGADAVGMSTATEVVAARHAGLETAGIAFISNFAAGIVPEGPDHAGILDTARRTAPAMNALLTEAVREFHALD